MDISAKGAAFVRLHEGFVGKWYKDPVGVGTIGVGFTWGSGAFREWWKANKPGVAFGPGARITRDEADDALVYLFRHEYGKAVNAFLGKKKVAQHVFDGMCSPVFNIGPRALKWKWAAAAKSGNLKEAATHLRTTATTARGVRLPGLVSRRKEEALLLERGIYTGVGSAKAEPIDAMADGILMRGERGPAVATLIRDLAALGYYDGVQDDMFGPGTESAVMAFQRAKGLKVDGWAGPATLTAIGQAKEAKRSAPMKEVVEDAAADDRTSTTEVSQWMEWLGTGGIGSVLLGFGDKLNPYVFNGLIVAGAVAMLGFGAYRIRERRRKKAMARAVLPQNSIQPTTR